MTDKKSKRSFPLRAIRYGFRIPGRILNRFVIHPAVGRWLKSSNLNLYVYDGERDLLRKVAHAERLNWVLSTDKACDAVPWLDRVEPLLKDSDVVFDVGANIGVVAHWFAKRCSFVHAFEPFPTNITSIETQTELRNVDNMKIHRYSLGKTETKMDLFVKGFHGHHSLGDVDNSPTVGHMQVDVKTIDNVCVEHGIEVIDFLKIDVEGFEADVLQGAKAMLQEKRISLVVFELKEALLKSIEKTSDEVFKPLLDAGYSILHLGGEILAGASLENPVDGDYLACLGPQEIQARLGDSIHPLE